MIKQIYYPLFLFLWLTVYGQDHHVEFRQFSTSDGLSENTVLCIYQDHLGFLWFGTESGLNQYDGYVFKIYQNNPLDSTTISNNHINSILEDLYGDLWIATGGGGLNIFHRYQNRFHFYQNVLNDTNSLVDNNVNCLYLDRTGNLWVGTISGLSLYRRETDSFVNYLKGNYIKEIFEDTRGYLWIGTDSNGLYRFDKDNTYFKHFTHHGSDPESLSSNQIETITEDNYQNLWIGTLEGGLNYYHREKDRFISYKHDPANKNTIASNTIYTLLKDQEGHLWAGTENAGLYRIRIRERPRSSPFLICEQFDHNADDVGSISNNTIRSLFEDDQGNLWIGTFSGGINMICRYKKQFINFYTEPYKEYGLNHDIVRAFWEDPSGHIWIGTDGGGLNYFNRSTNLFKKYKHNPADPMSISSDHILDLCADKRKNLWIATWDGLNYFNIREKRFYRFFHEENHFSSLSSSKVTSVLNDSHGNVWVGTISGLNIFDPEAQTFSQTFHGVGEDLKTHYIQSLYEDKSGNLWIATAWGLYRIKPEHLTRESFEFILYLHDDQDTTSLSSNNLFSIYEDSRGLLWFTTVNGLNCYFYDEDIFQSYTRENGLASNWISSIVEDKEGFLWLGTHKGISKFDPVHKVFINYDTHDGLLSDEFTHASLMTRSGEIVMGGKTGFTLFFPENIQKCDYVPPIVLTDFQIFNRSTPLEQIHLKHLNNHYSDSLAIMLAYRQNVISFEFAALDFTAPEKNQYKYKLEGFDWEWRRTHANRRFVTYTNLREGSYVFRVKGSNCDGVWNDNGLYLSLTILPPFWRTKWALLIYGIGFITVLFLLRQLIVYREKLKSEILLERKEAERIHELDEMKLRFFTNVSHEFRTPITLIIGLLERLMRSKGPFKRHELFQNYQIIWRNARRLLRLINQIMDIRRLEKGHIQLELRRCEMISFLKAIFTTFKFQAEQRNIEYEFSSNIEKVCFWFDQDKVDKIVYNLLSNAFKFTKNSGSIHMYVKAVIQHKENQISETEKGNMEFYPGDWLEIHIRDDGIGIPDEHLESIFDPFFQIENKGIDAKGTGVGLALTKELVNLHDGAIAVTSQSGSGSCFIIKLPLHLLPESMENTQEIITEKPYELESEYENEKSHTEKHHLQNGFAPLILVVEDEIDFCNFLRDELQSEYRVMVASNGEDAYHMADEHIPNLIVSDVRMPKMDGFTLCSALKHNDKTSHIPIILLTSQTTEESRISGFDLGADDYIEKPFDIHLLKIRIANLVHSRKKLKERFSNEIYLQPKDITITPEDERFLNNIIHIVDEHIEDCDFNVSHLGHEIGYSRVQLYRRLKKLTDLAPNDLIRTFRLKRAIHLLEESRLTVSEIAYQVGFKDPSYFCRCFRNQYQISPALYSKSHLKDTNHSS